MNLDSLSFALSQISYWVTNLSKKNSTASFAEISHLVVRHGGEADRHLFRCLFSCIDFKGDGKNAGRDSIQISYLIQEIPSLIKKSNFVAILCFAIDNPLHHLKSLSHSSQLFLQFNRILRLNIVQELAFAVALLYSRSTEIRSQSAQRIQELLPDFIKLYTEKDPKNLLKDLSVLVLHLLLTHLICPSGQNNNKQLLIATGQKDALIKALCEVFPECKVPKHISTFLYNNPSRLQSHRLVPSNITVMSKEGLESSFAEMIREVGYGFTGSVEECRNTLVQWGVRELNVQTVAHILSMMIQYRSAVHESLSMQLLHGDSRDMGDGAARKNWNMDVFVQVLSELVPHLNWRDVVTELDHPGFIISGKTELRLLMHALFKGLNSDFPIEVLYTLWNNTEGQLSWITQSLKNPDVFCLADFNKTSVQLDMLKTTPDDENRDISIWKSLGLIEVLLKLSEVGHYPAVAELFKFPHQHCPDMLLLSLLQINVWNSFKYELISHLVPTFLSSHANSAIVLHYAWHCPAQTVNVRNIIMHSMADWYMRAEQQQDQQRLSRILDIAQDLKALSMLLNANPFAFVIDLACLASRREFLKLDKWLTDKMGEHQEPFVRAVAGFLRRRCPKLLGPSGVKEESALLTKSHQLPPETLGIILHSLQMFAGTVPQDLSETILRMVTNANVLMKPRQLPAGVPKNPELQVAQSIPGMPVHHTNPVDVNVPNVGFAPVAQHGGPHGFPSTASAAFTTTAQTSGLNVFSSSGNIAGFPSAGSLNSAFPTSLSSLNSTPASPAKSFPNQASSGFNTLGPSLQAFNPIPNINNQLQGSSNNAVGIGSIGLGSGLGSSALGPGLGSSALGPTTNTPGLGVMGNSMTLAGALSGTGTTSNMNNMAMASNPIGLGPPAGLINSGVLNTSTRSPLTNQQPPVSTVKQPLPQMPDNRGTESTDLHTSTQFSTEVEEEANAVFQKIFNHPPHPTLSIEEVIDKLKVFKDSTVQKERDIFGCMLRNLFEEYRFFPQYPDRELHTTAVLFGCIIEQGLVTYMDLGIALRYVLEALKKTFNSKMYFFGIAALDRFKSRLKDYPKYCQHLVSIAHFSQFPPHLVEYIEHGARSQEPPNRPQGPIVTIGGLIPPNATITVTTACTVTTTTVTSQITTTSAVSSAGATATAKSGKPSIANATNIDTLLAGTEGKEEVIIPPESVQDKVFFIFNNLSISNLEQKTSELQELIVNEDYCLWLAQYMVMKRSSIEPNFHLLYSTLIETLKHPTISNLTITETYRNIKVLLRSDKGVSNFSDRSLLKNLGHWIGMLTLSRNKPILHRDLDLKSLLYEAYYKGAQELLYVVPFVAKVLESCSKSKIFKPPNPWTMAIMNVLAELHSETSLKLNLKFEIEVLCKTLNLDVSDLRPGEYLRNPERINHIECQLSACNRSGKDSTPQPEEPMGIGIAAGAAAASVPLGQPPPQVHTQIPHMPGSLQGAQPTTPAMQQGVGVSGASAPPVPLYQYQDLNILSMSCLVPHIIINDSLNVFMSNPSLKSVVQPAIEKAIQDLLMPVVERSLKVALTTCEQVVKKDFALDPEEGRIRAAAHHMARNMTAGMALITCREPLTLNITTNIKNAFVKALGSTSDMLEKSALIIAQDNTELASAFIQKTAVEKAIPEMDKRLSNEFELRNKARHEGRRYCDPAVLTYQAERMPEQIRLKVGGVTSQQIAVYEEFARSLPGFSNGNQIDAPNHNAFVKQGLFGSDEMANLYEKLIMDIDNRMHLINAPISNPLIRKVHLLRELLLTATQTRDTTISLKVLQTAVEGLLEGIATMPTDHDVMLVLKDSHLLVLKAFQLTTAYGPQWTNKQVTKCLMEYRDDIKFNLEAVELLIRNHLVNMQQYDLHLSQVMDKGMNFIAVMFSMQLVQRFCVDSKHSIQLNEADFYNTIDTLTRISAHNRQAPEGLTQLIETIRQHNDSALLDRSTGGPTSMMHSGISQAREFDDPPGLHDKTEFLLREWVTMYHSPAAGRDSTKAFSAFVGQMHQQGILRTDDLITRFFRLCTEMCVDLCYRALNESSPTPTLVRAKCFHTLDAFVRLISLLVKHSGDSSNSVTKINLLNKVLGIVAGVLLQDHEVRQEFQQLPYHRIFIMLFIELNAPERVLENINFQVLTAFCNTFHILRPAKAPAFAYAWLELVSHRVFIGRMLAITPQHRQGWNMYGQLLIDLFKFLAPFLRNADLVKSTQLLYKGTLRVLLVLLHDFPEFLCDFHYAFCDVIPPNCIQMRNLILSAFPRNMRLPDPFTPNLKVDQLQEINLEPQIMTNFASTIQPASFKNDLDSYLDTRSPVTFLSDIRCNLQISNEPGLRYNISLVNALVLYVGTQAISQIHQKGQTPSMSTIAHSAHMDIFQNLAVDLDTEGRYLFLNSISNQLRYPNSHTHYFSCTLLYLFAEANAEAIQEQITRVLLERLIVNRPHPWGLLITFIELIKNPSFKFWEHDFVHCAPEIHRLFESVARSCNNRQTAREGESVPGETTIHQ